MSKSTSNPLTAIVTHIQRFCVHDGNGLRTVIFFKGCPLRCSWCHNPECISTSPQLLLRPQFCTNCGMCVDACPQHCIELRDGLLSTNREQCSACGNCAEICPFNTREISGKSYTVDELINIVKRDIPFYETSGGGVTLSGGEVLCQQEDFLLELLQKLKRNGFDVAVDTCGYTSPELLLKILPFVDEFLYDIKLADCNKHIEYTGVSNKIIISNAKMISKHKQLHIRIPLIDGINCDDGEINQIISLLKDDINVSCITLLPYHATAASKYEQLCYPFRKFSTLSKERLISIADMFRQAGFDIYLNNSKLE